MRLVVLTLTLSSLWAQAPPSAADVVRAVGETYADIAQIEFSMTLTRRSVVQAQVTKESTMSMKISAKLPNKLRWELGDSVTGSDLGPALTVFDGKDTSTYFSKLNQYSVEPGTQFDDLKAVYAQYLPSYGIKLKQEAKFLREETIEVNGKTIDCYVIEMQEDVDPGLYPQWWTWWVDKSRHIVFRADRRRVGPTGSDEASMTYQDVKINEPISNDVFAFTIPPGATKITQ
jgi:outer membrane lipoprotein-sorting protein